MMTNVSIYSESPQSKSDLSTSGTKGAFLIDDKLSKFLSSVNKKDVSKVVDENGEPLVVYHGTSAEFTTFKKGRDAGMHFGTLEQATNRSSRNIMPVFLNIRNPKRTHDKMDGQAFEIKKAKKSKFDGLVYRNIFEGEGDSYVAFKPNQIKSATDNVGTFDSANDDIRFSVVGIKAESDFIPVGYDKTLSSLLDEAKELFRNGTDDKDIYSKTGWYFDGENVNNPKWKFEVQNPLYDFIELGVDEKLENNESLFLSDIFPEDAPIFKVYPHLKNISVVKNFNESEASFSPKTNTINLAPFIWDGLYNVNKIFGGKGKLSKKQQDEAYARQTRQNFLLQYTLEHELQHAIQEYEGFDRGSNPTAFFKILKMYLEYKNLINNISDIPDNIKIPIERFIKRVEEKFGITESDLLDGDVDDNLKAYAWSLYYNTKGEFEAFTTKYRLQQSEEERKNETFFETQEIVKSSLKKNAKRNVNTIFDSYWDTINSLTEDVNYILSKVFREYGHLQSNEKGYGRLSSNGEGIQSNASCISDFLRRISSSNTAVSTKKVDTGFDRQELRGNSQRNEIRFSLIGERGIANYGSEFEERLETAKELDAQGKHPAVKNKPDIDNSTSGSSIQSYAEDALPSIVNVSKRNDPSRRNNFSGVPHDKELLLNEASENNSESQAEFSFSDSDIHQKKRESAVRLAKKLYKRLGEGFDAETGEAVDVRPTQEDIEEVYMEDMGFLDDD